MPYKNEDNLPYGLLNPVDSTYGPNKAVHNTDNQSFIKTLREMGKERFTKDVLAGVPEFTAIVLRLETIEISEDGTTATINAFGQQVQANTQQRIYARIPEIHAHLPVPKDKDDLDVIRMYPLFIGSTDITPPTTEGDLIKVTFKNIYNQTGPTYLGVVYSGNKLNEQGSSSKEGDGQTRSGGSGSRYVAEPLTPSDPNYAAKLAKNMESVYRPFGNEAKNGQADKPYIIERGPLFKEWKRTGNILNGIIIHEAVGDHSIEQTEQGLISRGTGVHFMVDESGQIYSYNDPKNAVAHEEWTNERTIGIEVANPYNAYLLKDPKDSRRQYNLFGMWVSPWGHDPQQSREYVVPPLKECESLFKLVKWLCVSYKIPIAFPATKDGQFVWGLSPGLINTAGISSHQHTGGITGNHADGNFLEHYVLARFNNLGSDQAYSTTIEAARTTKRSQRTSVPIGGQQTRAGFGK